MYVYVHKGLGFSAAVPLIGVPNTDTATRTSVSPRRRSQQPLERLFSFIPSDYTFTRSHRHCWEFGCSKIKTALLTDSVVVVHAKGHDTKYIFGLKRRAKSRFMHKANKPNKTRF